MIVMKLHDNLPSFSSYYYYFNFGVNFFVCVCTLPEIFSSSPLPPPP